MVFPKLLSQALSAVAAPGSRERLEFGASNREPRNPNHRHWAALLWTIWTSEPGPTGHIYSHHLHTNVHEFLRVCNSPRLEVAQAQWGHGAWSCWTRGEEFARVKFSRKIVGNGVIVGKSYPSIHIIRYWYFRAQNPIPLQLHTVEASFLRMWTISSFNSEMMPDSAALLQGILNGFDDILVDSSAPRAVASMDSDGLAWELLLVTRCFFCDVWGPLMGGLHASQLCWDVFVVSTCFKFKWLQIQ